MMVRVGVPRGAAQGGAAAGSDVCKSRVGGPSGDRASAAAHPGRLLGEVFDAVEVPSVSVVATSYGGYFALRGTAARADKVDRLVTMSWSLGAPMEKVAFSMRMSALPGMKRLMPKMPMTPGIGKRTFRPLPLIPL